MVLSKREQYIAIGLGGFLVCLILYALVIAPYTAALSAIAGDTKKANDTLAEDSLLKLRQQHLMPAWQKLINGGLHQDESLAQSQARQALDQWAAGAGVTLESLVLERTSQQGPFNISSFNISFDVQGQSAMRSISRLLWALETSTIPMHVNSTKIATVREGTDQLNVKINVSTLYTADSSATGSLADAGGRP